LYGPADNAGGPFGVPRSFRPPNVVRAGVTPVWEDAVALSVRADRADRERRATATGFRAFRSRFRADEIGGGFAPGFHARPTQPIFIYDAYDNSPSPPNVPVRLCRLAINVYSDEDRVISAFFPSRNVYVYTCTHPPPPYSFNPFILICVCVFSPLGRCCFIRTRFTSHVDFEQKK